MKYIRYTFVDQKTKRPVSREPARSGPVQPEGIDFVFAIEASYKSGKPTMYGTASDDFVLGLDMKEVNDISFFYAFKNELQTRASQKRKSIEQGGIRTDKTTWIQTDIGSQNRISSLVNAINLDPELLEVDFETAPGQWTTMTKETALEIGVLVSRHVQACFSWCRKIHADIEAIEDDIEVAKIIMDEIQNFNIVYFEETFDSSEEVQEVPVD